MSALDRFHCIKFTNINKRRNKEPCTKKKLNPNRDVLRVINKLAKRNKENKNDKQTDKQTVMMKIVLSLLTRDSFILPKITLNVFFNSFVLQHLWKMSAGKYNGRANSEIGYWLGKVNINTINLENLLIDPLTTNNAIYRDSLISIISFHSYTFLLRLGTVIF